MKLLVLGGTGFVGRAIAELAPTQGHHVTVLNRGRRPTPTGVTTLTGDRTTPHGLDALADTTYDAVIDTWSANPDAVRHAVRTLTGRATHYTYISSRSVYDGTHQTPQAEDSPLVAPDTTGYAADKRNAELATEDFNGPVLLARAGLILGPHEDVGRLPWWLHRLHRGGPTLAPGPHHLPLQYIDVRDLAQFCLDAAHHRLSGPYNLVSQPGHTTMGELLDLANTTTGNHAQLHWTDAETIHRAGIQPWTELPIWLPPGPDHAYMHQGDVTKAHQAGLRVRPVADTITDTWAWLRTLTGPFITRPDRHAVGLDPDTEAKFLSARQ